MKFFECCQSREEHSRVSEVTGAFLTKRACQEYISSYGYNHSRPTPTP